MIYSDIKITPIQEYNIINFNNHEIKVLKYLPVEEKFDLIMIALQKSIVNGIYNPIRLKVFFTLNIMYLYTDILFEVEERVDEGALYDELMRNGLIQLVLNAFDAEEWHELNKMFNETLEAEKAYRTTAAAIIAKLVDDMPKNAEAAKNIVETFDESKFSEVLNFAKRLQDTE